MPIPAILHAPLHGILRERNRRDCDRRNNSELPNTEHLILLMGAGMRLRGGPCRTCRGVQENRDDKQK
jgi:hypothetical protein